jgi:hypothetical protein
MSIVTRWVGFDMDECVGSVGPMYTFLTTTKPAHPYEFLLAETELLRHTWLFRPIMKKVLRAIWQAHKREQIYGCFIYSNNGSQELVNFVRDTFNMMLKMLYKLPEVPNIFKMAVSYYHVCRPDEVKDYAGIVRCLKYHKLPPPTSPADLLFFDDLKHALADEIPHYVQVKPYWNRMPVDMLASAIGGVVGIELPLDAAKKQEQEDLQHLDYIFELQSAEDYAGDEAQWLPAIRDFLKKKRPSNTTKNAVNGGRRNRTRRLQKL